MMPLLATATSIAHPERLWLLWLLPVLLLFQLWTFRRRDQLLRRFVEPALAARLVAGVSRPRQILRAGMISAAVGLALLSLAGVRAGYSWEEVRRSGVDLVVALDVSRSMQVQDASDSEDLTRLERAQREVSDLLGRLEGDRVALVPFAGTAFIECPLTLDYGAASLFLRDLDTDRIPVRGTAIGKAIRTSLRAFEGAGSRDNQAILLITDGEDHSGKAMRAAEEAAEAGVRIFVIGIGRDEGAPIPTADGGLLRDRKGELVLSRLDEPTLQRIALNTGGTYVRSVTGDVDLETIYNQGIKSRLADQELESARRKRWNDRFQWLLGLSLLLLLLEPLVPESRRRPDAS